MIVALKRVAAQNECMAIDLSLLLNAYAHGIFPMADARGASPTFWVEPKRRAIIPLDALKVSRSLRKTIRQDRFRVTADTAFAEVMERCAEPVADRRESWINNEIFEAFVALHEMGHAHSVECWQDGNLVGGLYGLAVGRAFCGESMFSRRTDASKVALVWLVARLRAGGYTLLDCQFMTDHLESLGAIEISQQDYLTLLAEALFEGPRGNPPPNRRDYSAASPSGSAGSASAGSADWSALDSLLAASEPPSDAPSVDGSSDDAAASSGKLILHSFTQTS